LKILFNIRLFYGDLSHIFPCWRGWGVFGISCCASFLASRKSCETALFTRIKNGKSQRNNFCASALLNGVFYA
jgi:hypothetical protein